MDYDSTYVQELTKIPAARRVDLIRYYGRLPEQMCIEVHRKQTELVRVHRNTGMYRKDFLSEFMYSMLILALHQLKQTETVLQRKKRINLSDTKKLSELRVSRVKGVKKTKRAKDKAKIENLYYVIKQLRDNENLSWRQVSVFLKKYHRLDVSYSYLRQCYLELCDGIDSHQQCGSPISAK